MGTGHVSVPECQHMETCVRRKAMHRRWHERAEFNTFQIRLKVRESEGDGKTGVILTQRNQGSPPSERVTMTQV
jgi:hypothetical protein